jgi:hypothetical protein
MPTIIFTMQHQVVELRIRDCPAMFEYTAEVLLDVNRSGNCVRRLELLGSGIQFSLERALSFLISNPGAAAISFKNSTLELSAKYDEDANAAFLYLTDVSKTAELDPLLLKSSYTVSDDMALFGLGSDLGLVFIRFKVPSSERMEDFMKLVVEASGQDRAVRRQ